MAVKQASKYTKLETKLLSLSSNSKRLTAKNSDRFIFMDRSDAVIKRTVLRFVRNGTKR